MEGDRVFLRPMESSDIDDVLRMRSDPEVLAQLFSNAPPTREGHLQWLARIQTEHTRQEFMIVERTTGRNVGTIGLSHIDREHRRAEFGVLIGDPRVRGKSLASEASRMVIEYAFATLGIQRLYLHTFPDNEPAIRLYRKLGFHEEGVLQQHVVKNGQRRNVVVMGLLRGV